MEKKRYFYLAVIVMTLLYVLMDTAGIYKYIAIILVGIFFVLHNVRKLQFALNEWYIAIPTIVHCGLGVVLSFANRNLSLWTIKTLVMWMLPLIFVLMMSLEYRDRKNRMVDIHFWACVGAYAGAKIMQLLFLGKYESTFAFVFGLFTLYYSYRKKWDCVVLAGILLYLADKRIAMLAVVLCLLLMIFLKFVNYEKQWIAMIWGALICTCSAYVYSIRTGVFISFCEKFGIDTSHRIEVYPKIVEKIPDVYLLGTGLGTTNELLGTVLDPWLHSWFENPHNDFLKIFVDLGTIGLVLFLCSFFVVFYMAWKRDVEKRALSQLFVTLVYFMMLMTTDNVSIYVLFLIPMYSICLALLNEKETCYENHAESSR